MSGWIARVKQGLYIPLPVETASTHPVIEDPWIIAHRVFSPCYIGGWSAAEYWDFTDQIFESVMVVTAKRFSRSRHLIGDVHYLLRQVIPSRLFGLTDVWRGEQKVAISDPSRTVVDFFHQPAMAGGIQSAIDMYKEYVCSNHFDPGRLLKYAKQFHSGALFKRMGFVSELIHCETSLIEACQQGSSSGFAELDPSVPGTHRVSEWGLYVPEGLGL